MQSQNARLLQQLTDRDEYVSSVVRERLEAVQGAQAAHEERQAAEHRAAAASAQIAEVRGTLALNRGAESHSAECRVRPAVVHQLRGLVEAGRDFETLAPKPSAVGASGARERSGQGTRRNYRARTPRLRAVGSAQTKWSEINVVGFSSGGGTYGPAVPVLLSWACRRV
eukprot:9206593-Pyramimonas_sp.AAC.1